MQSSRMTLSQADRSGSPLQDLDKKNLYFTEVLSGLSPAPTPVKLTVTTTQEKKQRRMSLFRRATKPNLDSQGLRELLTTLHTTPSVSSRGKAGTVSGGMFEEKPQGRSRRRFVVSLCGGGAALVLVLVVVGWLNSGTAEWRHLPCDSLQCRYYAQILDDVANASIDPCHDFHAHVCSRWLSRSDLPVKETMLDSFLQKVATRAFKTTVPRKRQSAEQKAAQFFQSCNAVATGKVSELNALKSVLLKCGVHWPELTNTSRLLHTLFCLTALWNWSPIIKFIVDRAGFLTIRPEESYGETLLRRRFMLSGQSGAENQYEDYFRKMVRAFQNGRQPVEYEQHMKLEGRVIPSLYHSFVVSNSTTLYNQSMQAVTAAAEDAISLPIWDDGLRVHLNTSVYSVRVVSFENVEFFAAFFRLVASVGEAQMAYYHSWALVQMASLLAGKELAALYTLRWTNRWRAQRLFCAWSTHHYMGLAFYAAYMRDTINRDMTAEISALVSSIQQAALKKVVHSPWPSAVNTVQAASPSDNSSPLHMLLNETDPARLDVTYRLFPDMTDSVIANFELATVGRRRTEVSTRMPPFVVKRTVRYIHVDDAGRLVLLPIMFELPFFTDGPAFRAVNVLFSTEFSSVDKPSGSILVHESCCCRRTGNLSGQRQCAVIRSDNRSGCHEN
ncbi:hypothetical protein V5799_013159 [Amblyomma americanum]|uniref:Peptidase M13 N-terminal domain-containing protein n=1 Tax=Amblyomma americanum TaxID=6943 RepID=A0AAQ4E6N1_AMBAM